MTNPLRAVLACAAILTMATTTFAAEEKGRMDKAGFVVMDHLTGKLAVNLDRLGSVFFQARTPEKPARLRLNFEAGDNKTVDGAQAEPLWKALREGPRSGELVWVGHMGGTLGIPVRTIQSLFKSGEGAALSVRINYSGDPQGKTVQGAEAAEVWRKLAE